MKLTERFGQVRTLLLVLLALDAVFIALHGIRAVTPWVESAMFSLKTDGGLPELYQYLKWSASALLLAAVAVRHRSARYLAWSVVFTTLLAFDALRLHERLGYRWARQLDLATPLGMKPGDLGELGVSLLAGAGLLLLLLLSLVGADARYRRVCRHLATLVLLLAVFGLGFDMVAALVREQPTLGFLTSFAEEGGEMVVASLITAYTFYLLTEEPRI